MKELFEPGNNWTVKDQFFKGNAEVGFDKDVKEPGEDKFYLVWRTDGQVPTRKHATREAADEEAKRLAKKHPDVSFYVLEPIAGYKGFTGCLPINIKEAPCDNLPKQ